MQRPAAVRFDLRDLPRGVGGVVLGQHERHDPGDREQPVVGGRQPPAVQRGPGERGALGGRPLAAVRPPQGRRRGEHARADSGLGAGRLAVGVEAPQRPLAADAEVARREREGGQPTAVVLELLRELRHRPLGQRGALGRIAREQQRPPERVGGERPRGRVLQPLERLGQVLDGRRAVRHPFGEAELEQQRRSPRGRCRLRQRPAQMGDAALSRPAGHRGAARLAQQRSHPLLAALRSREQVRRDLLGRGSGVAQHARRLLVLQLALAERQLLVHGVAHERVHEADRQVRPQDLGARKRARGVGHARLVEAGERRDDRERGALGQDGDRAGDRDRVLGQPREPHDHSARDRSRADLEHHLGVGGVRPHAVGLERGQELAQEERVAARGAVAGGAERVVGLGAEPLADELADRLGAEGGGPDGDRRRLVGDLGEQRRVGARLAAAHGGRHEDRLALEAPRQVGEEAQRGAVAPVQVVDGQHERLLGGQVERHPVEPVQRGERHVAIGGRLRCAEDRGRRRRRAGQRALGARPVGDHGLEQLPHDAERELALELRPAARQHQRAVPGGPSPGVGEQRALADPGRTLDQHGAALAAGRGLDERDERGHFPLALDQLGRGGHVADPM